jgi:hypothetical protein
MRQTPTTLKKDFGSAPTVSSEKSIFTGCAALAKINAAPNAPHATIRLTVLLAIFMIDLSEMPEQRSHGIS